MSLPRLWKISRPRFWIYLAGPFLVGSLLGAETPQDLFTAQTLLFGLFFLLPANLLVYGVNDIFDYETDRLNPKKSGYEGLVTPPERKQLWTAIAVACLPFLPLVASLSPMALAALIAFVVLSIGYSAPPVRAKSRPFLDSCFNVLYVMPGLVGFCIAGRNEMAWPVLLAAACWTMAMHAFSAVPDIEVDTAAKTPTIATVMGRVNTTLFCLVLYLLSALLVTPYLPLLAPALGALYAALMLLSLRLRAGSPLMKLYAAFPLVNTCCGGTLTVTILLQKAWI